MMLPAFCQAAIDVPLSGKVLKWQGSRMLLAILMLIGPNDVDRMSARAVLAAVKNEWSNCVESNAAKLARGRDAADVVAEGALGLCNAWEPRVADAAERSLRGLAEPGERQRIAADVVEEGRLALRRRAIAKALSARLPRQ